MTPNDGVPFTTRGLPDGAVEITHTPCGTWKVLGRDTWPLGDVTLGDQMAWAQKHVCPEQAPILRRVRVLAGVA